ncbi:hypothetical protein SPF06_10910 [Sinomonas sp. JGH33]|uniref:F5/8 type C domain-containing protein n=1 Tax=Sinomonas terricola TaxID=3110330 RepID=A0ABU5T6T2_9MICC|nr:hypothetical protein [Sinomonas sp. JGH33]MEA5455232.1 hypothetical protein [Sinomonas sp. JGH33]
MPDHGRHGLMDYFRNLRHPYHWYRQQLLGIAPPQFAVPGTAARLEVTADVDRIPTDGTGDARLRVVLINADGQRVTDERAVTFTVVDGQGLFPSGPSITLSAETESMLDGEGAIEFRSYRPGVNRILVECVGLPPVEISIEAVGELQAVHAGAWRYAPPAPYLTSPPTGVGRTSLTAFRPVAVSSAAPGHPGSHATTPGSGECWRSGVNDAGEWIVASMEFAYPLRQVEVVFADEPTEPWIVEADTVSNGFQVVHRAEGGSAQPLRHVFEFPGTLARAVRLRFPNRPIGVEAINAFDVLPG